MKALLEENKRLIEELQKAQAELIAAYKLPGVAASNSQKEQTHAINPRNLA